MITKNFKKLALVGSAVASIIAGTALAAPNDTMEANIGTSSTITAVSNPATDVMDFGIWLVGVPSGAPSSTLVMAPDTGDVVGTPGAGVQLIELTGSVTDYGVVTVTLPAGANAVTLQMTRGAVAGSLGAGLALTDITYYNPDEVTETGSMAVGVGVPVTVDVGATGVAVQFGGTITATDTPADGPHADQFNVAFAY